jgi:hypothetical protein
MKGFLQLSLKYFPYQPLLMLSSFSSWTARKISEYLITSTVLIYSPSET